MKVTKEKFMDTYKIVSKIGTSAFDMFTTYLQSKIGDDYNSICKEGRKTIVEENGIEFTVEGNMVRYHLADGRTGELELESRNDDEIQLDIIFDAFEDDVLISAYLDEAIKRGILSEEFEI